MAIEYVTVGKALATGLVVGLAFTAVNLPIPAPPKLAGIMGIVGIYLGYQLGATLL